MIATLSRSELREAIWDMRMRGMEFQEIGKELDINWYTARDMFIRLRDEKSEVESYLTSNHYIGEHLFLHGTVADHLLDPEGEPPPGVEFVIDDIEYDIPKKLIKYPCTSVRGGYRETFTNRDLPGYIAGDGYECGTDGNRNKPNGSTKGREFSF